MMPIVAPQARCRAAVSRREITPPVGIYHRMWGAAVQDRAIGVHRPLLATALAIASTDTTRPLRRVLVGIDHCLLWHAEMARLRSEVCRLARLDQGELHVAFSHTHAAGLMDRSRADLPGGELIGPYLDRLAEGVALAASEAVSNLSDASVVYGAGRCDLAVNRDQFDERTAQYVCGFDPAAPADDSLLVARVATLGGQTIATVVNYACHPTTLAWQNTLISPDYVGALRQVVEAAHGGVCLFLQGASGDLGPRDGYVGDVEVADRNGRRVGFAAAAALEALPPPSVQYEYAGPIVSGATIGTWHYVRVTDQDMAAHARWRCDTWNVPLPYRHDLPSVEATRSELARWLERERQAREQGDVAAARDCRAHVERLNRQLVRIEQLPRDTTFPLPITLWQLGDGYWVFLEGEYYQHLQRAVREAFPHRPIVVATVVDGWRPAYLPTRETYGRGIYQEQVAVLAPGCLEAVVESVTARIAAWQ